LAAVSLAQRSSKSRSDEPITDEPITEDKTRTRAERCLPEVSCLSVNCQTEARELIIGCAGLLFVALLLCRFENLSQQICAEVFSIAPVIMLLRHVFY